MKSDASRVTDTIESFRGLFERKLTMNLTGPFSPLYLEQLYFEGYSFKRVI